MRSWLFLLRRLSRRLWLRGVAYAALGIAAALCSAWLAPWTPEGFAQRFGGGAVDALLNVLASGLLAVAIFSTTAVITAYTAVGQSATPRAAALIATDSQAQGALSTFVGGFLYSVVALSALGTGWYGPQGRSVLFVFTLVVLALVTATLLRWLDRLARLASVSHAVDRVEAAALEAIAQVAARKLAAWVDPPQTARTLVADEVGYIQNVDFTGLQRHAERLQARLWVASPPGALVHLGRPLLHIQAPSPLSDADEKALRASFTVHGSRSFEQDPRFGMIVLGEVAARALSPAVNDPGTAIDVIGTGLRLMTAWASASPAGPASGRRVHLKPIRADELVDDIFTPVARDGAGDVAVMVRLQKALGALIALGDPDLAEAARRSAASALERAQAKMTLKGDLDRVAHALPPGA